MKHYIYIAFILLSLSSQAFPQGHSGNGQENKPIGQVLVEIPDLQLLANKLIRLDNEFPVLIGELFDGMNKAICTKYPYENPDYIAFSSYDYENDLFRIDFYENYFSQTEDQRILTLLHELFHYVTRGTARVLDRDYPYDFKKNLKREFEADVTLMAGIFHAIMQTERINNSLRENLYTLLSKEPIYGDLNLTPWEDSIELYDQHFGNIKVNTPQTTYSIGYLNNVYPDWPDLQERTDRNPHYRRYFDTQKRLGLYLGLSTNVPEVNTLLSTLDSRLETPANDLKISWKMEDGKKTWTTRQEIRKNFVITPVITSVDSDNPIKLFINRAQLASLVLSEGDEPGWRKLSELLRFLYGEEGPARFRLSMRDRMPEAYEQHQANLQSLINFEQGDNIPEDIERVIRTECPDDEAVDRSHSGYRIDSSALKYYIDFSCDWNSTSGFLGLGEKKYHTRFFRIYLSDVNRPLRKRIEFIFPTISVEVTPN